MKVNQMIIKIFSCAFCFVGCNMRTQEQKILDNLRAESARVELAEANSTIDRVIVDIEKAIATTKEVNNSERAEAFFDEYYTNKHMEKLEFYHKSKTDTIAMSRRDPNVPVDIIKEESDRYALLSKTKNYSIKIDKEKELDTTVKNLEVRFSDAAKKAKERIEDFRKIRSGI